MSDENTDPIISARVLLVEDSKDHQFLFVKRLNSLGIHNITISETGEQAVDNIKGDPDYDLILVDYSLPTGLSGIDVIREIRNLNPEIPIIMVTGLGSEHIAVQAMKLGIQDYITKEDLIQSDLNDTIVPLLLERKFMQETVLAQRLKSDPSQLSISVFKFGQIGPEPYLTSRLPFENAFESEQDREGFLVKLGTHYMSATGTGHNYAQGLYELPVPSPRVDVALEDPDEEEKVSNPFKKYHSLVYGFRMTEKDHFDERIKQNNSLNYGLVVVIFPILYRSILPNRAVIEKRLRELLSSYQDMEELDLEFLKKTQNIFLLSS
ncbi:MAG: response regulator [Candidatus Hodarchaeales archaeon]